MTKPMPLVVSFAVLVLTLALSTFVPARAFAAPAARTVMRCFCQRLDAQRKAEVETQNGVPTTTWPDIGKVDTCIQTTLGLGPDDADGALQQERHTGALDGDDGVALCSAAGYSVDETTPEPASLAVTQGARESNCRMMAEPAAPDAESIEQITADSKKKTAQQIATFAAQMGISQKAAETALNRAASDFEAGKFKCP
jgi:hypothetical protein